MADDFWDAREAEGRAAFKAGATKSTCPFPSGRAQLAWINGWSAEFAETDEAKAAEARTQRHPVVRAARKAQKIEKAELMKARDQGTDRSTEASRPASSE